MFLRASYNIVDDGPNVLVDGYVKNRVDKTVDVTETDQWHEDISVGHFVLFRPTEPVHREYKVGAPAEEEGEAYSADHKCYASFTSLKKYVCFSFNYISYCLMTNT